MITRLHAMKRSFIGCMLRNPLGYFIEVEDKFLTLFLTPIFVFFLQDYDNILACKFMISFIDMK